MSLDQPPSGAAQPVPSPQQPTRPPRPSLVSLPPSQSDPQTEPIPAAPAAAEPEAPRRKWFGGRESETPSTAPDTAAASEAAKPIAEVKKEIKSLTSDAVLVFSRGLHYLLAAGDPPQRTAGVWIADADQVEKIATPAAKLLTGAVPPALLEKTVIYGVQLALGVGHYVTAHLAKREESRTKPGRERPNLDHTAAMSS